MGMVGRDGSKLKTLCPSTFHWMEGSLSSSHCSLHEVFSYDMFEKTENADVKIPREKILEGFLWSSLCKGWKCCDIPCPSEESALGLKKDF